MFCLICLWIKGWVNNREAGDLRRHRGHYDVNVMSGPIPGEDKCVGGPSSTMVPPGGWQQPPARLGLREDQRWIVGVVIEPSLVSAWSIRECRVLHDLGDVRSWCKMCCQWELAGVPNPCRSRFCCLLSPPKRSLLSRVWTLIVVRNHTWDWPANPLHSTSTRNTLQPSIGHFHTPLVGLIHVLLIGPTDVAFLRPSALLILFIIFFSGIFPSHRPSK